MNRFSMLIVLVVPRSISMVDMLVGGFAIGRNLFSDEAQQWVAGKIDDQTAHNMTSTVFETLLAAWDNAVIDR